MNWDRVNEIIDNHIISKDGRPTEAAIEESVMFSDEGIMALEVMNMMNEISFTYRRFSGERGISDFEMQLAGRYPNITEDNVSKLGQFFSYTCQ